MAPTNSAAGWRVALTWTWPPVLIGAGTLAVALFYNRETGFDPAWLLVPLNLVFLTLLPLVVAALAVPAYRSTGVLAVLAIGAGMLAVGIGGGAVPAVLRYVEGPNAQVTMHNVAVLIAGAAQLACVALMVRSTPPRERERRSRDLVLTYGAVVVSLAVVLVLVLTDASPLFFRAGSGATPVRHVVLGTAIEMFNIATVAWLVVYARAGGRFSRSYLLGLALFTVGLTAVFLQHAVGNAVGWAGRGAQYAGALYLLAAVLGLRRPAGEQAVHGHLGMSLFQSSVRFQPLVESSADAILVLGSNRHLLYWNSAAHRMFGYTAAEVFGRDVLDVVTPEDGPQSPRADVDRFLQRGPDAPGGAWEGTLTGRSGPPFTAELTLYDYLGGQRICVVRDLSALRAAQAQAAEADRRRALEAARIRLHQERERYAREVNDSIVQGLVAAEMTYDLGEQEQARELLGATSRRARRWIGELIAASGPLEPGVARRTLVHEGPGDPVGQHDDPEGSP